jgi:hypothetical protein
MPIRGGDENSMLSELRICWSISLTPTKSYVFSLSPSVRLSTACRV